ncbi:MAG: hypothetical protein JXL80_10005 [Planctomycetes bacterium]|nr:hypothetical protein [Planctomycetota bacterium]
MRATDRTSSRCARALAVLLAMVPAVSGCAGLCLSDDEMQLLEASTADARFVGRVWAGLSADEQKEFVDQNALRWEYFNDLAHGRCPTASSGTVSGSGATTSTSGTADGQQGGTADE